VCWDICGYVASGLVLAAFYMKDMLPLRMVALASNLAFIAYGLALHLTPIWLLHALLVPLNAFRLVQAAKQRSNIAEDDDRRSAAPRPDRTEVQRGWRRNAAIAL
jgi:hypothetical protein